MKILGIECSARACSTAVCEDGRILCESYTDVKLTHSETLMPMLDAMLTSSALTVRDIDYMAVAVGPGSFTGLRIGISAVKGMAFALERPCIGVSTLEALAYNLTGQSCIACCAMDARCNQVYTALFDVEGGVVTRMSDDCALTLDELFEKLSGLKAEKNIVLVGDGAEICYNYPNKSFAASLAPPHLLQERAASVCRLAELRTESAVTAALLEPAYLRLPQAERELKRKEGNLA